MKPTFLIVNGPHGTTALNSQDLRVAVLREGQCLVATSSSHISFNCSQYMADRIKKEIRDRYNLVDANDGGLRVQNMKKDHAVLCLKTDDGATVLVWPKALQSLQADGNKLVVKASVPRGVVGEFSITCRSTPVLDDRVVSVELGAMMVS
jgi:hypothetical protein